MRKLKVNQKAPHFRLQDQHGNWVDRDDYEGRRLLLYFFPPAGVPECITEYCVVRDNLDHLKRLDVTIVAISPDTPERNRELGEAHDLGFPLLSDPDHSVIRAYGAWTSEKPAGYLETFEGVVRSALLVNSDGEIERAWYDIGPKQTVAEVLTHLREER